jgi:hypothetical protein
MSAPRTLSTAEEPRVLLIDAPNWLSDRVIRLFSDHEIKVLTLSGAEILEVDAKTISQETVYKTIWWVDFSSLQLQSQILDFLPDDIKKSLVVLGVLPEQFLLESEQLTDEDQNKQRFFEELASNLNNSQLFFTRDLLEKNALSNPFKLAFRGHKKQLLLDPELSWHPTSRVSFFQVIAPYLIRPHSSHRAIIQGKETISSKLLKKIANLFTRYYQDFYELVPVVASRISPDLAGFIKVKVETEVTELVDDLVRNKERWQRQLAGLPSPSASDWQQIKTTIQQGSLTEEKEASKEKNNEEENDRAAASLRKKVNEGKRLINQEKTDKEPEKDEAIEGELSRIFHEKRDEKKEKRIDKKVKIVKKIAKKSQKNKLLFTGGVVTMILGGIVLILWGVLFLSTVLTRKELIAFWGNTSEETRQDYQSGAWANFLGWQVNAYQRVLGEEWLGESGELASFEAALADFQQQQARLKILSNQYLLGILGRGEVSAEFPEELSQQLAAAQQAVSQVVSSAQVVLSGAEGPAAEWLTTLEKKQQDLALLSQLPTTLTEMFGGNGKRTYAVLLQNNLELRPTGGFIQAVGFLTFDDGLLVDTQLVNTYQLDERVLASVLAPAEVRRYLGEENWFLRDSNWNPDFPQTAQRVAWFIRQAVGLQVDGVWALNYLTVQEVLDAVGPLELAEYDELLTADNLLERVEFHSDDELAGSGDSQEDYALAVFSQLIQQLQTMPQESAEEFLAALRTSLEEKQLLISLFANEPKETMQKMGWSGEIINPVCPQRFAQQECLVDQVFQVEANVGLNRVNDYISRQVEHRVDFSQEKVRHTRLVTLENTARSEGWPLGTYKAYLRFIIDGEAQPQSVTVNGQRISGENLTVYGEGGRRVVGVPFEVPKQSTTTIEFNYLTEELPGDGFSYLLFDQKQPGIEDTSTTITFHNPDQQPTLIAPSAEVFGSSLEFSLIQNDHLFVGANFQ